MREQIRGYFWTATATWLRKWILLSENRMIDLKAWLLLYSLTQKQCPKFWNEKFWVIFSVKLLENLYASTYAIIYHIYKAKKSAAASARLPAAAACGRRNGHWSALLRRAMHYKRKEEILLSCFFVYYSIARSGVAANRVAKMPISQGCHLRRVFDFIYIILDIIATCM